MTQTQFATAYESQFSRTVRFLASKGVSHNDAEEVAQAAWARGWERRAQLRQTGLVGTWVNSIALNILRNRLRHRFAGQELPEMADETIRPGSHASKIDAERMLRTCGAVDQSLLSLHHVEGFSTAEAGRKVGLNPTAARVRLMRARRRLKRKFCGKRREN